MEYSQQKCPQCGNKLFQDDTRAICLACGYSRWVTTGSYIREYERKGIGVSLLTNDTSARILLFKESFRPIDLTNRLKSFKQKYYSKHAKINPDKSYINIWDQTKKTIVTVYGHFTLLDNDYFTKILYEDSTAREYKYYGICKTSTNNVPKCSKNELSPLSVLKHRPIRYLLAQQIVDYLQSYGSELPMETFVRNATDFFWAQCCLAKEVMDYIKLA